MMSRKKELYSSAKRSKVMIRGALIDLMREKRFDDIFISEIMKRADLVRRTFYAHYKTKEDVILEYIDELISESFDEIFDGVRECNGTMALVYFRLWDQHKDFVNLLKDSGQLVLLNNFHKQIKEIDNRSNVFSNMGFSESIKKYAAKFYAGAMWSVLTQWIETGMKETPEELAALIQELFNVAERTATKD